MPPFIRSLRDFFISIQLTVALLFLSLVLVFVATLDQTQLGIWGIQQKWFHSFVVYQDVGAIRLPVFPGGYLIGGMLFFNLIACIYLHHILVKLINSLGRIRSEECQLG